MSLTCAACGSAKFVETRCKQKWCPVCARAIAAKRVARYALAVGLMEWPLFVTLTIPPTAGTELQDLRRLKRGFTRLRRMKIWTDRVKGGVAGLEITSRSHKFHPHLHTVVDCKWLAHATPAPQRGESRESIRCKCRRASAELGRAWARSLSVKSDHVNWDGVIYKVKRSSGDTITSEILKYAAKGSDLVESKEPIGEVIRALQCTRLVTSFGSLYGKRLEQDGSKPRARPCECCGEDCWVTEFEEGQALRSSRARRA